MRVKFFDDALVRSFGGPIFLMLLAMFGSTSSEAASFDCGKASTTIEKQICRDPHLSKLDERLSAVYSTKRAGSSDPSKLLADERAWMAQRNKCETVACLSEAYSKRLSELDDAAAAVGATTQKDTPSANSAVPALQSTNNPAPSIQPSAPTPSKAQQNSHPQDWAAQNPAVTAPSAPSAPEKSTNDAIPTAQPNTLPPPPDHQNATPQVQANQNLRPAEADQSNEHSPLRDAYVDACAKVPPNTGYHAWIGTTQLPAITSLDEAVKARRARMRSGYIADPLSDAMLSAQLELQSSQRPWAPINPVSQQIGACLRDYIAYVRSISDQSLEVAQKEEESERKINAENAARAFQEFQAAQVAKAKADVRASEERVLALYHAAAEQGNAPSQRQMGVIYDTTMAYPYGVTSLTLSKDDARAAEWYAKAAAQGDAPSSLILCKMYYDGRGVEKDELKADQLCENGGVEGRTILQQRLITALLVRAENGDAQAQLEVGIQYELDYPQGFFRKDDKALFWYQKAAEQGIADAQNRLGVMYARGLGAPRNTVQAVTWYRKAADQGYALAQSNLGSMYLGDGEPDVKIDAVQAAGWLTKAAEQGIFAAQYSLGQLYEKGEGVSQDDAKAEDWYLKAAQQGYMPAQLDYETLRQNIVYKAYIKSINDEFQIPKEANNICLLGARVGSRDYVMVDEFVAMLAQTDDLRKITFITPGIFSSSYKIDISYTSFKPGQLNTIFLREVVIDKPSGEIFKSVAEAAQDHNVQQCLAISGIEAVNRDDMIIDNNVKAIVAAGLFVEQFSDPLSTKAQSEANKLGYPDMIDPK